MPKNCVPDKSEKIKIKQTKLSRLRVNGSWRYEKKQRACKTEKATEATKLKQPHSGCILFLVYYWRPVHWCSHLTGVISKPWFGERKMWSGGLVTLGKDGTCPCYLWCRCIVLSQSLRCYGSTAGSFGNWIPVVSRLFPAHNGASYMTDNEVLQNLFWRTFR